MHHSAHDTLDRTEIGPLLGMLGGALGMMAGLTELTIGPEIRSWVGNKEDTTGLGILTILLSFAAFAGARYALNHPDRTRAGRYGVAAMILIPAGICFTTVGTLWYLPGLLLIVGTLAILREDARRRA